MAIRNMILKELNGGNWRNKFLKILEGYFHKEELIKTLEVLQHLSALSYTKGVFGIMESELSSVRYARDEDFPCDVSFTLLNSDINTWFFELMTVKMFVGMPARHAEALAKTFGKQINGAKDRGDVMAAVVCKPMPTNLCHCTRLYFHSFCNSQGNLATDQCLDGIVIDESWFCQGTPLSYAGWQYAWSSGLNVLAFPHVAPEQRTAEFADLHAIDAVIMASVRVLLSGMIGELKSRVDIVTALQTKTLSAIMAGLAFVVGFMWHHPDQVENVFGNHSTAP